MDTSTTLSSEEEKNDQVIPVVPEQAPQVEVGDIASALSVFNKAKQAATQPAVPEAGADEAPAGSGGEPAPSEAGRNKGQPAGSAAGTGGVGQSPEEPPVSGQPVVGQPVPTGDTGGAGAVADTDEGYDVDAATQSVREQCYQIAAEAVVKEMQKRQMTPAKVRDLMQRDQDGTVRYINPQNKQEFTGVNALNDAQAWVNSYNQYLQGEFNDAVAQLLPRVEQSYKPQLEFAAFIPRYDAWDKARQDMFEEAVRGYELTDNSGEIVGYNCDLNLLADQMERQIAYLQSMTQQLSQVQEPVPVTQPVVSAPTQQSKSATTEPAFDPYDFGSALSAFNKAKKASKQ